MKPDRLSAFLVVIIAALVGSCADSGPGGAPANGTAHYDVPTAILVDEVEVEANVPSYFTFTVDVPPMVGPLTELTVDMAATLAQTSFTLAPSLRGYVHGMAAGEEPTASVAMRGWIVDAADAENACLSGDGYGPFAIEVANSSTLASVTPPTATARDSTVGIINAGSFAVCVEVVSPVDATFSVDSVPIDVVECDEGADDISGRWVGTYTCENTGCEDDGGDVDLTIEQDGHRAVYTDSSGARYSGTVCGNVFRFDGGVAGVYRESGTFTAGSGNSASKTSSFQSVFGSCRGDCTDDLHRP